MKTKAFMTMAAAAMALAACSNDENGAAGNGPVELRLTSGVEVQQTRAAANTQDTQLLEENFVVAWVDDAGTNNALYSPNWLIADGNGGFTKMPDGSGGAGTDGYLGQDMYFPQTGNNVNIYAMAGWWVESLLEGGLTQVLPTSIAINSKYLTDMVEADLLYAVQKNVQRNGNPTTQNLTFYHMLSKLEVAVVRGAGSPGLSRISIPSLITEGTFTPSKTVDMTSQPARAALIQAGTKTSSVNLGGTMSPDFTEANIVYNEAIIIPQDMNGKVLEFHLSSGGVLKYPIPAGTTFESGKKYRYQITMNLTGLTVTSTIEDWDALAPVSGSAEM